MEVFLTIIETITIDIIVTNITMLIIVEVGLVWIGYGWTVIDVIKNIIVVRIRWRSAVTCITKTIIIKI